MILQLLPDQKLSFNNLLLLDLSQKKITGEAAACF
jgi:hypothetical protein